MAYEQAIKRMDELAAARELAASKRRGVGLVFGGHGGKGHGAVVLGGRTLLARE